MGTCTTPFPIIYFMPFHGDCIQMSLFPEIFKWESQNLDSCCPKTLDVHFFSNQVFFENPKAIFYRSQKYFSNGVYHTPIKVHLNLAFKGFMVGSQIGNLAPTRSFNHNSCKLNLNEQCEGILNMYTLRPF